MLIGEIVKRSGLSKDTIRFYEKQGLISVSKKERRFNNYKEYSEETLARLLAIKNIKNFGFTLNETGELLDLLKMNLANCNHLSEKVEEKIAIMDLKIKELQQIKSQLINGLQQCNACCEPIESQNCPMISLDGFILQST